MDMKSVWNVIPGDGRNVDEENNSNETSDNGEKNGVSSTSAKDYWRLLAAETNAANRQRTASAIVRSAAAKREKDMARLETHQEPSLKMAAAAQSLAMMPNANDGSFANASTYGNCKWCGAILSESDSPGICKLCNEPLEFVASGKPKAKPRNKSEIKRARRHTKRRGQHVAMDQHVDQRKVAASIAKVNQASGGKNDKAAALAAAIQRGITVRPSGKWQAQLYFEGKSRYIGVFDSQAKATLAYEIVREKLKSGAKQGEGRYTAEEARAAMDAARKAAFEGVNEKSLSSSSNEEPSNDP